MSSTIKKGTRVIINIERRTLKIILWLNLFIFIGLFLLGFLIGKSIGTNEIKITSADEDINMSQIPVIKKNDMIKKKLQEKKTKKPTDDKKNKKVKKEQILKYPSKIVVEKKPSSKTKKKKKPGKKNQTYTIQVISLKNYKESIKIKDSLKRQGCDARVSEKKLSTGIWYRVRIGNYKTKEIAFKQGKKLEEKGIINSFWISEND